jgi:hypothetical protein
VVACVGYVGFVLVVAPSIAFGGKVPSVAYIAVLLMVLALVAVDAFGLRGKLPLIRERNVVVMVVGWAGLVVTMSFALGLLSALVDPSAPRSSTEPKPAATVVALARATALITPTIRVSTPSPKPPTTPVPASIPTSTAVPTSRPADPTIGAVAAPDRSRYSLELLASNYAPPLPSLLDVVSPGIPKYYQVDGQVRNIGGQSLKSVLVVVQWYDAGGNFIIAHDSLIAYNPILPGQTSPFTAINHGYNPAMAKYTISFKFFSGGEIPTLDSRR